MQVNQNMIVLNKENNQEINLKEAIESALGNNISQVEVISHDNGFTYIKCGENCYPIELLSNHQNEYNILINGVEYNFSLETPFSLKRKRMLNQKTSESSIIRLKAPMPGKILEVMVKTGDQVKAGDTLLILEAMKMQNAILASTKGIIKKVVVSTGQNTSKSDLLIELEKEV